MERRYTDEEALAIATRIIIAKQDILKQQQQTIDSIQDKLKEANNDNNSTEGGGSKSETPSNGTNS